MHHRIPTLILACCSATLIATGSMHAATLRALSAEIFATTEPQPAPDAWYEPEIRAFESHSGAARCDGTAAPTQRRRRARVHPIPGTLSLE
ncbi:MAG: hypothetical protein KF902_07645 [Phycisphaeraceae bacterium]|nr:hypothetical protein [Phycisphaeraceae bacterium]